VILNESSVLTHKEDGKDDALAGSHQTLQNTRLDRNPLMHSSLGCSSPPEIRDRIKTPRTYCTGPIRLFLVGHNINKFSTPSYPLALLERPGE